MNLVWNFPQYFMKYRLWIYDWDKPQPWMIAGQAGTPMQKLLVAVPVIEEMPPPPVEEPKVSLTIKKLEAGTNQPLAGVHFRIAKIEDGTHYLDRITDESGEINISNLEPGVYSVKETATTSDHILDVREYHVELFPGQTSTLTLENQMRP